MSRSKRETRSAAEEQAKPQPGTKQSVTGGTGNTRLFNEDDVIKALVQENPKRPDTIAHFQASVVLAHDGHTVRQFKEAARQAAEDNPQWVRGKSWGASELRTCVRKGAIEIVGQNGDATATGAATDESQTDIEDASEQADVTVQGTVDETPAEPTGEDANEATTVTDAQPDQEVSGASEAEAATESAETTSSTPKQAGGKRKRKSRAKAQLAEVDNKEPEPTGS